MYLFKQLESKDKVTIKFQTVDEPGQFSLKIGLVTGSNTPDYSNVACQLEMHLQPNDCNELKIDKIVNGESQNVHTSSAVSNDEGKGNNFSVTFRMREKELMDIHLGDSNLESMQLVHEVQNIRFLTVGGDISKVIGLDFKFEKNLDGTDSPEPSD